MTKIKIIKEIRKLGFDVGDIVAVIFNKKETFSRIQTNLEWKGFKSRHDAIAWAQTKIADYQGSQFETWIIGDTRLRASKMHLGEKKQKTKFIPDEDA